MLKYLPILIIGLLLAGTIAGVIIVFRQPKSSPPTPGPGPGPNCSCTGKPCDADDGCGKKCPCPSGQTCLNGKCVSCVPNCAGKQCGPDGCGGNCPNTCIAPQVCDDSTGMCRCVPNCVTGKCGPDGCGGVCPCPPNGVCQPDNSCCIRQCDSITCDISDGCGGMCGCPDGQSCVGKVCQ